MLEESLTRSLLKAFWNCGDNQIIEFAIQRARLNKDELMVIKLMLDECKTQEMASEEMFISTRQLQIIWKSAADKLLNIPWVMAYAEKLNR